MTILFADIRSFTPWCSTREPMEVVNLLNVFFHEMTECVFRHRGTLDKYIGDEIMAVFGVPQLYEEHSLAAAQAALDMKKALAAHPLLSQEIKVGISLHRGEAIHGFVGSKQRMQYTVIGDSVNVGSRFCDLAQGGQILISQTVYEAEKDNLEVVPLEKQPLQGKEELYEVYELTGCR